MLDKIDLLINYAFEHLKIGNLDKAEFLLLDSLSIVDGIYGIESPQYATILSNYCYLLYLDNRLKEAIEYGENAKLIFENFRLVNSSEYFACLNHLGVVYDGIGMHDRALQIYENVLTKVIRGKNSLDIIQVLSNIGSQLIKRQKYESAVQYLQHACKIMENQKEVDKSNYPLILNTLGLALNGLNKSKKAIKIYQKARKIMIKSKRTNSSNYYSILNNLALSYSKNHEYKKALQIYILNDKTFY